MVRSKTSFILLTVIVMAIILSGCTSPETSPGKSIVAATVGAPTPVPTEPPEPTAGPTWVPSPTPIPPPLTLLDNPTFIVTINGDQRPISGDPDQDYMLNPQYAIRQDTVKFTVQNTGDTTLKSLKIIYKLVTPQSFVDAFSGQTSVSYKTDIKNYDIGDLQPEGYGDVVIESPAYGASLEANVTITAEWDGGSLDLYATTLTTNFNSGTSINPANQRDLMMHGSADN